jgi:hypothetical protein
MYEISSPLVLYDHDQEVMVNISIYAGFDYDLNQIANVISQGLQ